MGETRFQSLPYRASTLCIIGTNTYYFDTTVIEILQFKNKKVVLKISLILSSCKVQCMQRKLLNEIVWLFYVFFPRTSATVQYVR